MAKFIRINGDRLLVSDAIQNGGDQCESCGSWKKVPSAGYRGWWTQEQTDEQTGATTHWVQTGFRYRRPGRHEARGYLYCAGCRAAYRIEEGM